MATKTKTVGKTTNTTKKGVNIVTVEDALKQLMMDYNKYQEYRKDNNSNYNFASKQQVAAFAKQLTTEELTTLVKVYATQRKIQQKLSNYLYNQKALDRAYGKEDKNIMELSDEERELINKRRAKQQEKETQKQATKRTHKAITKSLKKGGE